MVVQDRYSEYQPDQRKFFDEKIVEDWRLYDSRDWDATRRFEVARLMSRVRPVRILDVGCGCGFHDREMARYPGVERVDAIDYSARSIERAEETYGHEKARRRVADIATLEPETPYDLVVSFQVIEHAPDTTEFLRHCGRCCRPGGHVVAFTVNRMRPYNRKRAKFGKEPEMEDPMHKEEFIARDMREFGRTAGLETRNVFHYAADAPRLPVAPRLWLGYLVPRTATRLAAIWRKPE